MVDFTRAIVKILKAKDSPDARGTGFFVTKEGHVLTCYHVISKLSEIWMTWDGSGSCVQAELLAEWSDETKDFALLKVSTSAKAETAETGIDVLPLGTAWQPHDNVATKGFQYSAYESHPAAGVITGDTVREGCRLLVLENATHVQGGMSGAPAWSLNANCVIGIVTLKWEATNTAYVTPLAEIAQLLRSHGENKEIGRLVALTESKDALDSQSFLWREVADRVDELLRPYSSLFVGRSDELMLLDRFVEEATSGVLVVTANAGFGKTALLAQWLVTRRGQGRLTVYHFFSSRYDVTRRLPEAYRNLLRQLYSYYGLTSKTLPEDENALRADLYATIQDNPAREDQPLVILLDGLDEAERLFPRLLPSPLPKGVFLVVSARAGEEETPPYLRDWVEGAKRITLSRLPRAAVQDYLQRVGNGGLAPLTSDTSLVSQVEDKTEGLPLYLRFLAEDMIAAQSKGRDVGEVVAQSPSGFKDYVQKQVDELAQVSEMGQQQVQNLFALLSVARGPLSQDDILSLTGLTVFSLRALPYQVTRWFTSERSNSSASLYSFAHPLLAMEFEAALGAQADQARSELLDYCAHWQDQSRPYALRYYPDHLLEAARISLPAESNYLESLYNLVWDVAFDQAEAKTFPDAPDLPLRKIELALQGAIEADDAAGMAQFVLAYARRLLTLHGESPLEALQKGSLERAWNLAGSQDAEGFVLWHLLVTRELKERGRLDDARTTLQRLAARESPRLTEWHVEFCSDLVLHILDVNQELIATLIPRLLTDFGVRQLCGPLVKRGLFSAALAMAQGIQDNQEQAWALAQIAEAQAATGQVEAAMTTVQAIQPDSMRSGALTEIAKAQAAAGQIEAALATVETIQPESMRPAALARVAKSEAVAGRAASAQTLWTKALVIVQAVQPDWMSSDAMADIAKAQAAAGQTAAALVTARAVQDEKKRALALVEVANAEATAGRAEAAQTIWTEASESVKAIPFEQQQALALTEIVRVQAAAGQVEAALATVQAIQPDSMRSGARTEIAKAQAAAGQIETALETVRAVQDEKGQWDALTEITKAQVAVGPPGAAEAIWTGTLKNARAMQDVQGRMRILAKIATALTVAGQIEVARNIWSEAVETVKAMRPEWMELGMLELASAEAAVGQTEGAQSIWVGVLGTVTTIEPVWMRSDALADIAEAQAAAGQTDVALETARAVQDEQVRSRALAEIAKLQTAAGQAEAARDTWIEALKTAQAVQPDLVRSEALAQVAKAQVTKVEVAAGQLPSTQAIWTKTLEAVRSIQDDRQRLHALCDIASAEAAAGQSEAAQTLWAEALAMTRAVQNEWGRSAMLAEIAASQSVAGRAEAAAATWAESLATAQVMQIMSLRKHALAEVGKAQAIAGQIEPALETAGLIKDWFVKSEVMAEVAKAQAIAGQIEVALETARAIQQETERSDALVGIAKAQAAAGQAAAALQTAQDLPDEKQRSEAMAGIAKAQASMGLGADAIQTIESVWYDRSDYLSRHLPEVAITLFNAGDVQHFKKLLLPCARYLGAAYQICGFLGKTFPAQAPAIRAAVEQS